MKQNKLSEAKIVGLLKEGESGAAVEELCRTYGIARSTYYKLRSRYGGMEITDLHRLRNLEKENQQLKHMYAELSLEHRILKDVIEKKFGGQRKNEG